MRSESRAAGGRGELVALGHVPEGNELQALATLTESFEQQDYAFDSLLLSVVGSEAFALRMEPEEEP